MKRLDPILLKLFLYGIPLVAGFALFSHWYNTGGLTTGSAVAGFLNGLAGLVVATWMTLAIYLSFRLLVSGPFRDQVLARITFIRERDEREAILTGKATKKVFLTSLAFLILLFCLSSFQVSVYRVPLEHAVDGKTGVISLGLGFSFLEQVQQDHPAALTKEKDIFTYQGLPLSSAAIVLLLIAWQIVSYNFTMRRLMR
ncbi:MAG: hypothetical protein KQJ78_06455 [Deltaproteobacteria bacterium]|nr:hypothetical protein [Deltaproteobacteria bacterium]